MNNNLFALLLIATVVGVVLLKSNIEPYANWQNNSLTSGSLYTSYFTPWWRNYFGPYYGTSATSVDRATVGPYYNYLSYWRRPQYYNYWRAPYYYRRPVYRPYLQDSILGRRARLRKYTYGVI